MTKKAINNQVKLNQMTQVHQNKKVIRVSHNMTLAFLIHLKPNSKTRSTYRRLIKIQIKLMDFSNLKNKN